MSAVASVITALIAAAAWLSLIRWIFVNRREASFWLRWSLTVFAVGSLLATLLSSIGVSTGGRRAPVFFCLTFLFVGLCIGIAICVLLSGEFAQIRRRKKEGQSAATTAGD